MGFDLGIGEIAATLASIAPYASLASGAVGALGALNTAAAQGKSAAYQAQVAANNAQIAGTQADTALAAGEQESAIQGLKTRAVVGSEMAAQGASNIDVNSGSAVDVRSSAAALGELNALNVRQGAVQQWYGYKTSQAGFTGQESLAQAEAAQAPIAGGINANSSLLSGASGAGTQYAAWQRVAGSGLSTGTPGNAYVDVTSSF